MKFYAAYNKNGLRHIFGDANVQVFRFDPREDLDKFLADHPASAFHNQRYAVDISRQDYHKILEEAANN